ncbi:MAG: universal stress protein [Bacillota bacterium]
MKMLVCTDGSEHSVKALEKASSIAEGYKGIEVAVIHVYENKPEFLYFPDYEVGAVTKDNVTKAELERFEQVQKQFEKEREEILNRSARVFEDKGMQVRKILEEGHPSETILHVAERDGFDMVVIGSRGLGGLKKLFLGSVSNAVLQQAKNCIVAVVK